MRKLIILFLVCCFTNCNAQIPKSKKMKLTDKEIKEKGYQIKKEDTIFMKDGKLDIAKLERLGTSNGAGVPTKNGWKHTTSYTYYETLENGMYIYISGNNLSGYSKTLREKNSLFETFYGYHNSGNLKNTGNNYVKRFSSGIRYYFDEQGTIEKYEDYDAPYEFNWEDVLEFLKNQKIKKEDITEIYRSNLTGQYQWEIIYKPKEFLKTDNVKVLTLDAKTGEVIKEEIRDVSRQLD